MSFFFTKSTPRAKATEAVTGKGFLAGTLPTTIRRNPAVWARLGCAGCPLNKASGIVTPLMEPTLSKGGQIYFLAEAPGRDEDENTGRPLTGPSGSLLRECIPEDWQDECSFDNIINCRPPGNRTPQWQEIECCRPRRTKYIEQAKPKLIVGLGAVPLQAILGSSDLQGMRGRLFAVKFGEHHCWFLPTYHPSFILRIAKNKRKPLNSMMGHCFRMDIRKAFELVADLELPHIDTEAEIRSGIQCFDGSKQSHHQAIIDLLYEARKAPLKAVDIETKGLRPYKTDAAIMTCALSFEDTNFAFALDHPHSKWPAHIKEKIRILLESILKDDTVKIAHNVPFELEWFIWYFGKHIINHHAWHCTQMQAHFLDERRGKSRSSDENDRRAAYQALDFLCKQHFGFTYKSLFKLNKKDMSKSDLGETLLYNGVDTKITLRLHHWQIRLLKKFGLYKAYLEARPRQTSVAMMQYLGVNVDQAEVKKAQKKLGPQIKVLEANIAELKVVKAFVQDHKEFNPLSNDHAITIFKDYLKRPEVQIKQERHEAHNFNKSSDSKKRFDKGPEIRYSVDKGVLAQIDHPLAGKIIDLRNRTKLKSTYVDCLELGKGEMIYPDGAIHCNFNTTFAETGRTSSDDPNMQNYPQRTDAWVRNQIAAKDGHLLLAFDYGQLEACTAAMCSQDKVLVKALWEDYDIHMEWAIKTAHQYPAIIGGKKCIQDKDVMKKFRSKIKNKLVFPAIFGAQNSSIAGYLDMPVEEIDVLMREFWKTFYGLAEWQDKLMKKYYEDGYAESPTGRRRHYPMTRNQAINDPIQSVACDIVCRSMNDLSELATVEKKWYLHPILNIHDDLSFQVQNNDRIIEKAIKDIYRIMLTPNYDFINVPLSVTCSIGKHWFGMEEIGKFWSHKDIKK
jgi:uracil-DNA glycosylase family 4